MPEKPSGWKPIRISELDHARLKAWRDHVEGKQSLQELLSRAIRSHFDHLPPAVRDECEREARHAVRMQAEMKGGP